HEIMPDNTEILYHACAYHLAAGNFKEGFMYLEQALILDFDGHEILYDIFTNTEMQKAIARMTSQYKKQ
ncbi:MAG: hypothetical protein NZ521_01265, partial [Flammeovirgaceae bacterium]|nr:hypothetical protein [Flammeovirgaceae bacterium]